MSYKKGRVYTEQGDHFPQAEINDTGDDVQSDWLGKIAVYDFTPAKATKLRDDIFNFLTGNLRVYAAEYCSCIHESSYETLGLFLTKKSAKEAIKKHKAKITKEWNDIGHDVSEFERWNVRLLRVRK